MRQLIPLGHASYALLDFFLRSGLIPEKAGQPWPRY